MKQLLLTLSLVTLTGFGSAFAAGDAEQGKVKSATCAGCHGADGKSLNPVWPNLGGQHPSYISKQLHDFKLGLRNDPMMAPMAMPLSDQDIEDLAAFFASQGKKVGEAAADKVELGQEVYRAGNTKSGVSACIACHGPKGGGNPQANFPNLSGQNADYTAKALRDFRDGNRTNDGGKMMRNIAEKMSDAEIDAVAQYIQGLH